jgi:hypothetical protein
MDDQEQEELLYRLDERTERIEDELLRRINELENEASANRGRLDQQDDRLQSVEKDLSTARYLIGGLVTLLSGATAKILNLI